MTPAGDREAQSPRTPGARVVVVSAALLAVVALGCGGSDSTIVLTVTAQANLAPVVHVRVTMSNAARSDTRVFPPAGDAAAATPLSFPATLAIVIPGSRSGNLDLALDGLGATMAVVANGAISLPIDHGGRTNATVELRAGQSLCGNGVIDPGEECDDGNRISGDGCDFECQLEQHADGGRVLDHDGASKTDGAFSTADMSREGSETTDTLAGMADGHGDTDGGAGGAAGLAGDLISNGDFSAGMSYWHVVGNGATDAMVMNGQLCATVSGSSPAYFGWPADPQGGVSLAAGSTFQFSYRVSTTASLASFVASVGLADTPYTVDFASTDTIPVGTSTTISHTFTLAAADVNAGVAFTVTVANVPATVCLADVFLGPLCQSQNSIADCRAGGTPLLTAQYWCSDLGSTAPNGDNGTGWGTCGPDGTLTSYYAGLPCPFDVGIANTPGWTGPCPECLGGTIVTNSGGSTSAVWSDSASTIYCCNGSTVQKISLCR